MEHKEAFETCGGSDECGLNPTQCMTALFMCDICPTTAEIGTFFESKGKPVDDEEERLSLEEFEELCNFIKEQQMSMEDAFKKFDKDDSGFIEKEELKKILKFAQKLTGAGEDDEDGLEQAAEDVMAKADKNGDGQLDIEELAAALRGEEKCID